ncbi:hypothetical protein BH24ACT22_BH24ACT22_01380 [soil metagenome]
MKPCPGCRASVPETDGPTHRYIGASSGCWEIFGEVLAREYEDYRYWPAHRMTVDAYAAQHPGTPSPQSTNSVAVHLISLYLTLEKGLSTEWTLKEMKRASDRGHESFFWLEPPMDPGEITVLDVRDANNPTDHKRLVEGWARSVWEAWEPHHETVRKWAKL